jgi:hypothetical protein
VQSGFRPQPFPALFFLLLSSFSAASSDISKKGDEGGASEHFELNHFSSGEVKEKEKVENSA